MHAKIQHNLDKIEIKALFLRFFIKNPRIFLLFPKKGVPLHPQKEICTS